MCTADEEYIRSLERQLTDEKEENAKLRAELVAAWASRDWLASLVPPDQIKTSDEYHVTLLPLGELPEDQHASNAQASPKSEGTEPAND